MESQVTFILRTTGTKPTDKTEQAVIGKGAVNDTVLGFPLVDTFLTAAMQTYDRLLDFKLTGTFMLDGESLLGVAPSVPEKGIVIASPAMSTSSVAEKPLVTDAHATSPAVSTPSPAEKAIVVASSVAKRPLVPVANAASPSDRSQLRVMSQHSKSLSSVHELCCELFV